MPEPYRLSIRADRSLSHSRCLPPSLCLSVCLTGCHVVRHVETCSRTSSPCVSLGHRWVCCAKKFADSKNLKPISMTFHEHWRQMCAASQLMSVVWATPSLPLQSPPSCSSLWQSLARSQHKRSVTNLITTATAATTLALKDAPRSLGRKVKAEKQQHQQTLAMPCPLTP